MTASSASTPIDPATVPTVSLVSSDAASAPDLRDDVFEQRLVADAKEGCQESFRILVERHQGAVFRLCFQLLGCTEDAREASQDTFVRAYHALPRFKPRARFFTWLFRIAVNRCRDGMRARATEKRSLPDSTARCWPSELAGDEGACPRPDPAESLALAEDIEKLSRGLEGLASKLREALVLAVVEGLSYQDCAEVLGCSVRAVEGRIYRARRELMHWWDA